MYVSAFPLLACGVLAPPLSFLASSPELPHAAAPTASTVVQPNTAIRYARMFRPPPVGTGSSSVSPNLVDERLTPQPALVDVAASQRRMGPDQPRQLEPGVQGEPV